MTRFVVRSCECLKKYLQLYKYCWNYWWALILHCFIGHLIIPFFRQECLLPGAQSSDFIKTCRTVDILPRRFLPLIMYDHLLTTYLFFQKRSININKQIVFSWLLHLRPLNWGGGMGFDMGDADVVGAPVAVLKNDLFDEISSQEGSWTALGWSWFKSVATSWVPLSLDMGKKCRDWPQPGIERETKTAQKKHTAVVAVLIHSPCNFEGIAKYSEYLVPLFVFGGCLVRF